MGVLASPGYVCGLSMDLFLPHFSVLRTPKGKQKHLKISNIEHGISNRRSKIRAVRTSTFGVRYSTVHKHFS
jgi:hypothetical protein